MHLCQKLEIIVEYLKSKKAKIICLMSAQDAATLNLLGPGRSILYFLDLRTLKNSVPNRPIWIWDKNIYSENAQTGARPNGAKS